MAKLRKPKVLVKSNRQVGKSVKSIDKQLKALAPGKRRSSTGKIYYENRRNRSDLKDDTPSRIVKVKKHTRLNETIDVKKHDRKIVVKSAVSGSKMKLKDDVIIKAKISEKETKKERQQRYMKEIKNRVNAPFVSTNGGAFGSETVFVDISLDNKSDWANGYRSNSRHMTFRLLFDEMKMDVIQEYYKFSRPSFRKSKFKNVDDAINRINDYIIKKSNPELQPKVKPRVEPVGFTKQEEQRIIKRLDDYLTATLIDKEQVSSVKLAVIGLVSDKESFTYEEIKDNANKIIEIRKLKTYENTINKESKDSFQDKKERKIERFEKLSEKNRAISKQNSPSNILGEKNTGIPFGQPILVGHHSERAHRRAIAKMDSQLRKGFEASGKADYYKEKANIVANSTIISSDDPEAITKLRDKLDKLEDRRTKIKAFNIKARKEGTEQAPSYMLQNLSGNIRTVKLRIQQQIKKSQSIDKEYFINDVRVEENVNDNRIRIHFDGKPSQEMINKLKNNGFRWSPFNTAWQRQLNDTGRRRVNSVLKN